MEAVWHFHIRNCGYHITQTNTHKVINSYQSKKNTIYKQKERSYVLIIECSYVLLFVCSSSIDLPLRLVICNRENTSLDILEPNICSCDTYFWVALISYPSTQTDFLAYVTWYYIIIKSHNWMDTATYVCMYVCRAVCMYYSGSPTWYTYKHAYDLSVLIGCEPPPLMKTNFSYASV